MHEFESTRDLKNMLSDMMLDFNIAVCEDWGANRFRKGVYVGHTFSNRCWFHLKLRHAFGVENDFLLGWPCDAKLMHVPPQYLHL